MAGYVSSFATGAAIEAALNKANNSQSALNATQLKAVNSGADSAKITQIATNTDDIAINRAELVELVDNGNKNLLKCTAVSTEKNGITFTVNTDGSIVINGTAPNDTNVDFDINDGAVSEIPADKVVVLSGCPEGGSNSTYALIAYSQNVSDIGEGVTFTTTESNRIYIRIYKGTTVNNLTFRPMICTKAAWDISKEFMPYIPKGSIIDTLWSEWSGALIGTEYTMAGNINDYDLICVKIGTPSDIQQSNLYTQLTFAVAGYTSGELIGWEGYYQRYCHMSFHENKFTLVASGAGNEVAGYRPGVYEVIGIKFAQVSGSGGNNYSETELLASPLTGTISTIPLTDSMNKFNQLVFTFGVTSSVGVERFTQTVLVSDINNTDAIIIQGMVYLTKYYGCHYELKKETDTSLSVVEQGKQGWSEDITIFSIKGIKCGTGTSNNTSIKTLTYTGDGLATTTIAFPETPTVILSIDGPGTGTGMVNLASFRYGANAVSGSWSDNDSGSTGDIALRADYSGDTLLLTTGQNAGARCNVQGATYTVTYM